jgi:hypothetical protein
MALEGTPRAEMGFEQLVKLRPQGGKTTAGMVQKVSAHRRGRLLHCQPEEDLFETQVHFPRRPAAGTPAFIL